MTDETPRTTTRAELDRLIEDRRKDRPSPAPRPSWMLDKYDPEQIAARMRERRIRYLQNRLDGAVRSMEREFDQNS